MDFDETSGILKVLGHPVRLQMVRNLMRDECNVGRMVERLGIPQSTVSQHLRILQDRGILRPRKDGVRTCYVVVDTRVRRIVEMLEESSGPGSDS
ncbi:MAG: winged helix-turn-helix transcriptional regulator [Actinobacteria bacterium]|nr:winged helix-turn-helix transcriptional regulator [Actinomycetota bacterium]